MNNYYIKYCLILCFFINTAHGAIITPEQQQVNAALANAALTSTPLFSAYQNAPSVFQSYQTIMPLLLTTNVTPSVTLKAAVNFNSDVLDKIILMSTPILVGSSNMVTATNDQLANTNTLATLLQNALTFQLNNLKNQPTHQDPFLQKNITDIFNTTTIKQGKISNIINTQNIFLALITQTQNLALATTVNNQSTLVDSQIASYQSMLSKINQTIIDDTRQQYLSSISRLMPQIQTTAQKNAFLQLLNNAAQVLPEKATFINALKATFTQQPQSPTTLSTTSIQPTQTALQIPPPLIPITPLKAITQTSGANLISAPSTTQITQKQPLTNTGHQQQPSLSQPSLSQPSLSQPSLSQPSLSQPSLSQTSLSQTSKQPISHEQRKKPLSSLPSQKSIEEKKDNKNDQKVINKPTTSIKPAQPTIKAAIKKVTPMQQALKVTVKPGIIKPLIMTAAQKKNLEGANFILKTSLDTEKIIRACLDVFNFSRINPDKKLTGVLTQRLAQLYNGRAAIKPPEQIALNNVFQAAANNKEMSPLITKKQLNNLDVLAKIIRATTQKTLAQKIERLTLAINTITPNIDPYEKSLFLNKIINIFNLRKKITKPKLIAIQNFFAELSSKKTQPKFDKRTFKKFSDMSNILACTLTLTSPPLQKNFSNLLDLYKKILTTLSLSDAEYERDFFTTQTLPSLLAHHGNLNRNELGAFCIFLDQIIKTPNIFFGKQRATVLTWRHQLATAESLATPTQTYIDTLIVQGLAQKNITAYRAALKLFTQHTSNKSRLAFISALNSLYNKRNASPKVDTKQLIALLIEVGMKKITPKSAFLSMQQKKKLNEWLNTLTSKSANSD